MTPAVLAAAMVIALDEPPPALRVITVVGAPEAQLDVLSDYGGRRRERYTTDGGTAAIVLPFPARVVATAAGLTGATTVYANGSREVGIGLLPTANLTVDVVSGASIDVSRWHAWAPYGREKSRTADVPAGTHLVVADTITFSWASWLSFDAGSQRVALPVIPPAIEGLVCVHDGGCIFGARFHLSNAIRTRCSMDMGMCGPYQPFRHRSFSDDIGAFALYALDPGEYRLLVYAADAGILRTQVRAPSKAKLYLEPGQPLDVHVPAQVTEVDAHELEENGRPSVYRFASAQAVNGVAHFEHLAGVIYLWGSGVAARVDVGDAGPAVTLGLHVYVEERRDGGIALSGTVHTPAGRPVRGKVCAMNRNIFAGCSAVDGKGGFAIEGPLEKTSHLLRLEDSALVLDRKTWVEPGETAALVAVPQKKGKPRVVDVSGKPVPRVIDGYDRFDAPGFLPAHWTPEERYLTPSVLVTRPYPVRGTAPPGTGIAFLCAQPDGIEGVTWSQHNSDVSGVHWTHWPGGVQCVVATTYAGPDGTFALDSLPRYSRRIVAVEAHLGAKVLRVPYAADAGFDFVF